ncbi:Pisatin demethylase [Cladorrhinum sp. PSN332]|nr:Pisatin demethylase [Cladorrhinum sp. PSN332]
MTAQKLANDTYTWLHLPDGLGNLNLDRQSLPRLTGTAFLVPLASLLIWFTISWATNPLRKYPGPFLAAFTNLWRFNLCLTKAFTYTDTIKKLHEKYGPVVRIGPNTLDLDYPELIRIIYSTDGKWIKTKMYENNSTYMDGKQTWTIFSTQDQAYHARIKRPIVKYFTLGNVLGIEPHMNVVIKDFIKHLDTRFAAGPNPKDFDLVSWINYFAWDQASEMTFSKRYGYMDSGRDFDSTLLIAEKTFVYFQAVSQIPWLDNFLDKNPIVRIGPPNLQNAFRIASEALTARLAGTDDRYDPAKPDYLQHFIDSKATHPDLVDDSVILTYIIVTILGGADTSGITLQAIFYFVMKNPDAVQKRLVREVRSRGWDKDEVVSYGQAKKLHYLDACVKEAMRLHPVLGMLLERYVPEGGLVLPDGSVVPAGTGVGMNPYVVQRNKGVLGEDADEFRPERWLQEDKEGEEEYKARVQRMSATDLSFGGGSRICIGRHLALMEVYKVVATLVNRYDMKLTDPEREWKIEKCFFIRPRGIITRFKIRE